MLIHYRGSYFIFKYLFILLFVYICFHGLYYLDLLIYLITYFIDSYTNYLVMDSLFLITFLTYLSLNLLYFITYKYIYYLNNYLEEEIIDRMFLKHYIDHDQISIPYFVSINYLELYVATILIYPFYDVSLNNLYFYSTFYIQYL
jgi:hypothetical protein